MVAQSSKDECFVREGEGEGKGEEVVGQIVVASGRQSVFMLRHVENIIRENLLVERRGRAKRQEAPEGGEKKGQYFLQLDSLIWSQNLCPTLNC